MDDELARLINVSVMIILSQVSLIQLSFLFVYIYSWGDVKNYLFVYFVKYLSSYIKSLCLIF